ncbi:hypothetical protein Tco_1008444 [Tanacetum coccineum]
METLTFHRACNSTMEKTKWVLERRIDRVVCLFDFKKGKKIFLKDIDIIKKKIVKGDCYQAFKMMSMLVKIQDRKMAMTIKTNKEKDLKISDLKTKSKDNDKGSRSKITQHEGTSLQQDKVQDQDSRAQ